MKYFGTQTNYLLDKSKPYQRPELSHAGAVMSTANAELRRPTGVGCSESLCKNSFFDHLIHLLVSSKFAILKM
jgi:hypothetical protein